MATIIRKGMVRVYDPQGWDKFDPKTNLKPGDTVKVVHPHGCPPPGTMGHCHVEGPDGKFAGLVCVISLRNP